MQVCDAETGELLVIPSQSNQMLTSSAPSDHHNHEPSPSQLQKHTSSSTRLGDQLEIDMPVLPIYAETQSTRAIGGSVAWAAEQHERTQLAQEHFRASLRGLRQELQAHDLPPAHRESLQIELLDKMKAQYSHQLRHLIVREMERELDRDRAMRSETSQLAKARLETKHQHDRVYYRLQLDHFRQDCEMSLAATMAQYNLLR